jgi:hypothetical protein
LAISYFLFANLIDNINLILKIIMQLLKLNIPSNIEYLNRLGLVQTYRFKPLDFESSKKAIYDLQITQRGEFLQKAKFDNSVRTTIFRPFIDQCPKRRISFAIQKGLARQLTVSLNFSPSLMEDPYEAI